MIIHSGHYRPVDAPDLSPEEIELEKSLPHESIENSPIPQHVSPLVAKGKLSKTGFNMLSPKHDLQVTLRILPRLIKYTGSTRFGLDSRGWGGSHDGESLHVERVEKLPRGSVSSMGRKGFSKQWGSLAKSVTKVQDDWMFDDGVIERFAEAERDPVLVFSQIDRNALYSVLI